MLAQGFPFSWPHLVPALVALSSCLYLLRRSRLRRAVNIAASKFAAEALDGLALNGSLAKLNAARLAAGLPLVSLITMGYHDIDGKYVSVERMKREELAKKPSEEEWHRDCMDFDMDLDAFCEKWRGRVPGGFYAVR